MAPDLAGYTCVMPLSSFVIYVSYLLVLYGTISPISRVQVTYQTPYSALYSVRGILFLGGGIFCGDFSKHSARPINTT